MNEDLKDDPQQFEGSKGLNYNEYVVYDDAQVKECSKGEDEFDCDWHKRSTVDTITTRQQFGK